MLYAIYILKETIVMLFRKSRELIKEAIAMRTLKRRYDFAENYKKTYFYLYLKNYINV